MIHTLKIWMQNAKEEIEMYEQAKTTGVFISLEGREMLRKIQETKKEEKQKDDGWER